MKGDCHSGNPLVFDTGKVKVYAGGTNRNGGWHRMTFVPNLALGPIGVIRSASIRDIVPKGWKCSSAIINGNIPTVIEIDWPDFGVPSALKREFWIALVEDIKEKGITTISTQCMGGHGRTGVQLAILAHLLIPKKQHTWKDVNELVTYIRDSYCQHAVESKSQQLYISEVCEIPEGEPVTAVEKPTNVLWGDDTFSISEEELLAYQQQEEEQELAEKKNKSKRKKTDGAKFKGKNKPKNHGFKSSATKYDSPLVRGFTYTFCASCQNEEWRRANSYDMNRACVSCGSEEIIQIDEDIIKHKDIRCSDTGLLYNRLEMYDEFVSKYSMATNLGMEVKIVKNEEKIKCKGRWYPPAFLMIVNDGEMVPANDLMREEAKKKKKKQKSLDSWTKNEDYVEQYASFKENKNSRPSNDEIEGEY